MMHKSVLALGLLAAGAAQAVSLTGSGLTETFDGMGTSGTAAPTDWTLWVAATGSNSTWTNTTGIAAAGVAALVPTTGVLTAITTPSATNNNGYNAANIAPAAASDRVLATSPTSLAGGAVQLSLTNNTGAAFSQVRISYDTVRYTAVTTANELPGYWLFYSLNAGTSWTNVAALNPDLSSVPNSVGTTQVLNASFALSAPVATGGNLLLRWVDDNAQQTSPDQIIGLNNVAIAAVAAVPEPGAVGLLLAGLAVIGQLSRRRRVQ